MIQQSANALGQIKGIHTARSGVGDVAFAAPTVAYIGVAGIKGLGRIARDGTVITNPWFFSNKHSGYGKRGLDPDEAGNSGLVQGLHGRRRKG